MKCTYQKITNFQGLRKYSVKLKNSVFKRIRFSSKTQCVKNNSISKQRLGELFLGTGERERERERETVRRLNFTATTNTYSRAPQEYRFG